jgi:hypothetical protein
MKTITNILEEFDKYHLIVNHTIIIPYDEFEKTIRQQITELVESCPTRDSQPIGYSTEPGYWERLVEDWKEKAKQ